MPVSWPLVTDNRLINDREAYLPLFAFVPPVVPAGFAGGVAAGLAGAFAAGFAGALAAGLVLAAELLALAVFPGADVLLFGAVFEFASPAPAGRAPLNSLGLATSF